MILSIVVIGRNEGMGLGASLDSVLRATRDLAFDPSNVEVIYVDCGSSDHSVNVARAKTWVQTIELRDEPLNAASARNAGIEAASGEFIQLLDGDMHLSPYWPRLAIERMRTEALDALGGRIFERELTATPWNTGFGLDWPTRCTNSAILGGAALWRASSLRSLGAFDVSMTFGEDPDLYLRARSQGFRISQVSDPMASHDLGLESAADWWRRAWRVGCSRALVFLRHRTDVTSRRAFTSAWRTGAALMAAAAALTLSPLYALMLIGFLVAGLLTRHALRAHSQGQPLSIALVHASHVYAVKVPVALAVGFTLIGCFQNGESQ